MSASSAWIRVRTAVHIIPPLVRPFVLLVIPVTVIHALTMTPWRHPGSAPARIELKTLPREDAIRRLIETNKKFVAPKVLYCLRANTINELEKNALVKSLQRLGYGTITNERMPWGWGKLEITIQGQYALGHDFTDGYTVALVIARKEFIGISTVNPPLPSGSARMHDAVPVSFTWRWVGTNEVGNTLDSLSRSETTGYAYLSPGPKKGGWTLLKIDFRDRSSAVDSPESQ